ncbi:PREDICTED: uncharacterized protein LOC105570386 [Vollenhovia emeryi]|uniref:uncharacterized protein LOC105570386 n=1 Tax=Vollenhovia emeryi TaxID=411798 RepID=UPI0005F398FC|nr:PREDICTED: uncharacterized protein LOC105570386 [Vollenhovia emeryi]
MLRSLGGFTVVIMTLHLNMLIATDWWWGERDLFGPCPRIPPKDKVEREIKFAEECRKFIPAPKTSWIR